MLLHTGRLRCVSLSYDYSVQNLHPCFTHSQVWQILLQQTQEWCSSLSCIITVSHTGVNNFDMLPGEGHSHSEIFSVRSQ